MPLAEQLAQARLTLGFDQDDVAAALGVSRVMVSYWESGKRSPNDRQLAALGRLYRADPAALYGLAEHEQEPDVAAMMLRSDVDHIDTRQALPGLRDFTQFLDAYATLAREAKITIPGLTQSPFINSTDYQSGEDARRKAEEVRSVLRLGLGPIGDIDEVCEGLGITVYRARLGSDLTRTLSGAFYKHPDVGFTILVNLDMTRGRRRFTVAHEIAHALFHSSSSYVISTPKKSPREKFADQFAGEFLMPTEGMRRYLEDRGMGPRLSTPAEVVHLQRYFGVSYATALLRCLVSKFIDHRQYDEFRAVKPLTLARMLGYAVSDEEIRPDPTHWRAERFPARFRRLLASALDQGVLSIPTAAQLTNLTIDDVEELMAAAHFRVPDSAALLAVHETTDETQELDEYAATGVVNR